MNTKLHKALSELKALLFAGQEMPTDPTQTAPEMVSVKAKDGTEYFVDKLEAGGTMNSKNETGELMPVDAGTYELEDGSTVTVIEGGVIESIAQASEVKAEEAPVEEFKGVSREEFDALQSSFNELKTLLSEAMKANEGKFKAMFTAIASIEELPAATSVKEKQKSVFSKDESGAKEDVRRAFASLNAK